MAKRGLSILLLSLLLALVLTIVPLPIAFTPFRPDWTLIVLIYWSIALPSRVNIGVAWLTGFIVDVLLGSVLGIHALASAVVVYVSASNYQKIRNWSVWQQALVVLLLSALYHLMIFWIERFLNDVQFLPTYLWPCLTSMLIWPWAFMLLRKLRRQFKVS